MVSPWRMPSAFFALVILLRALTVTAEVTGLSHLVQRIFASSANGDTEGITKEQWDSSKRSVHQGIEYFKTRSLELAQSHLLDAVKNDSLNGEALFNLGVLSEEKHEHNTSCETLQTTNGLHHQHTQRKIETLRETKKEPYK